MAAIILGSVGTVTPLGVLVMLGLCGFKEKEEEEDEKLFEYS